MMRDGTDANAPAAIRCETVADARERAAQDGTLYGASFTGAAWAGSAEALRAAGVRYPQEPLTREYSGPRPRWLRFDGKPFEPG